jgi:hypothetical protein
MLQIKGTTIKNIFIFLLLIAGVCLSTNQQKKKVIPLKVERNRTLVTVKIGNIVIPNILIDTGFGFDGLMIYNPAYRDSLDLTNTIKIEIGGAGRGESSEALMLDSSDFSLGQIEMLNQRIIVLQSDTYKGFPSNGIIGYSIFGHYVTEFDYDNNTMNLYNANEVKIDDGWTEIPIYFKKNKIPWIDVSVVIEDEEPVSLSTYIDYAAGDAIVLLEKPNMKFNIPAETENEHIGRGLSGDIFGKKGNIAKLIIGPYELNNVHASFASAKVRSKQENADAILGNGSLKKFNLIFDYFDKKLYIKPNTHFYEPFN